MDQELPGTQRNRTKRKKKGNRNRPSDDFKLTIMNMFMKIDDKNQNVIRDWEFK